MAHFANIQNGQVTQVLVVDDEHEHDAQNFLANQLGLGGFWIQTSYNGNFRNKFAGIGDIYDKGLDAFFDPQPFPSWQLSTSGWVAPLPKPDGACEWDETAQAWVEVGE